MKKFLILTLCASLFAGCSCAPKQPASDTVFSVEKDAPAVTDSEFEQFLDQFVIDYCQQSILTAQLYFEDPASYGIDLDKCDRTLGTILPDEEDIRFARKTLDTLQGWDPSDLTRSNRQIYVQMVWEYSLSLKTSEDKYQYLDNIWSGTSNVLSDLTTVFSEYQLDKPEDVDILVSLIEDVPHYADQAIDYTKTQIDKGLFAIDYDSALQTCQDLLKSKDKSPIEAELDDEVAKLDLTDKEKDAAKKKISMALKDSFFPALVTIEQNLKSWEKDNKPMEGLSRKPQGKEYYQLLIENFAGSSQTPDEIQAELEDAANAVLDRYTEIMSENPAAIAGMMDLKTNFKSVSEIMPFLEERYPATFPLVAPMEYEIKPLSDEQSTEGTMAYFVNQPIDSKRPFEIRYNKRDYGEDPSSLELYNTFAHEGVPGHMYQAQYMRDHFTHPVQYMLSSFGMQEGYASYAAFQTVSWTGLDESALEVWKLNELYSNYCILLMDLQINYEGITKEEFSKNWGEGNEEIYDRLCEEPGLFFGYYYGCYKLEALEQIAKDALGNEYDPIRFNNSILEAGNVNFDIVEENVQNMIDSVRKGTDDDLDSKTSEDSSEKDSSDSMTPFEAA